MNSKPITETWFTLRFARWIFRLVWDRRVAWTLVCVVSLLTLYYQWENRRSARELRNAHQRMVERVGTDDWGALAAPGVPDEQSFFALPVVEAWLHRDDGRIRYIIPKNVFLPVGFVKPEVLKNEAEGTSRIDFASWAAKRDLKGEKPEVVMNRELGDGNGLLPQLVAGLSRPFSAWKPAQREMLSAAGANPYEAAQPNVGNMNDTVRDLGLHLRCAAAAGDVAKAHDTALVLLRLFPESATSHHWLIGSLVSLGTHELAFEALQDALGKPVWDSNSLRALQLQLGKINDLEVLERGMSMELLTGFGFGLFLRDNCLKGADALEMLRFGREDDSWLTRLGNTATRLGYIYGPTGWLDANTAFYMEMFLGILGPKSETAWLDAAARGDAVKKRRDDEYRHVGWNMRRKIGAVALPNIGNIWDAAAKMLFHRRCLIIACALEQYRMKHGEYPPSLDAIKDELKLFQVIDPAQPAQLPGYRLEAAGYTLSTVWHKDWLWRMKRTL
jgi:hypothetical protein